VRDFYSDLDTQEPNIGAEITTEPRINDRIRTPQIRLINYTGEQVGVVDIEAALAMADEIGARQNQTHIVVKEVRMTPKIENHDYETKRSAVEKFLKGGDKVKITMKFRGREQTRPELGFKLLQRLAEDVKEIAFVEFAPKQEGRQMTMVLGPTKKKTEAVAEQKAARAAKVKAAEEEAAAATN